MSKKVALYLRVSTAQQTTENQRLELEAYCKRQGWQVVKVYDDSGFSGKSDDRPALQEMLADSTNGGRFSVVVCWKIDRIARSTINLLQILQQLRSAGVDFVATTQSINTTDSAGRMLLVFLGAIAEFQRETVVENVRSGLRRAVANGVKLGRPRVGFDIQKALQLRQRGLGYKQIAKDMGVARTTIFRTLRAIPQTPAALQG